MPHEPNYHYGRCLFQARKIIRATMLHGSSDNPCAHCGKAITADDLWHMQRDDGRCYHTICFFSPRHRLPPKAGAGNGKLPKVGPRKEPAKLPHIGKRRTGGKLPKVGPRKPKTFF